MVDRLSVPTCGANHVSTKRSADEPKRKERSDFKREGLQRSDPVFPRFPGNLADPDPVVPFYKREWTISPDHLSGERLVGRGKII